MQHHPARVERLGMIHLPALFQNQLQDVADVFVRAKHICFHDRLANFFDLARVWQMCRIIDQERFTARPHHFINHARTRGDDVHVVFAAQPLLNDFHVQQPEKSAAKTETERDGTFRRVDKR